MSVFYGVRLTEEMNAKIEATGKGKSEIVKAALESYLNTDAVGTSGGKRTEEENVQKDQAAALPLAVGSGAGGVFGRGGIGGRIPAIGEGCAGIAETLHGEGIQPRRSGVGEDADPVAEVLKYCRNEICGERLYVFKGKWVCKDEACCLNGQEQGRVR